jgi:hypothetical protein
MPCALLRLSTVLAACLLLAGCYSPPAENSLAGQSEASIRLTLGQPHNEFSGHYGLPSPAFTKEFVGEVKTSVFAKPGGELYVSFEKRNSVWIAICNSWLPKGSEF